MTIKLELTATVLDTTFTADCTGYTDGEALLELMKSIEEQAKTYYEENFGAAIIEELGNKRGKSLTKAQKELVLEALALVVDYTADLEEPKQETITEQVSEPEPTLTQVEPPKKKDKVQSNGTGKIELDSKPEEVNEAVVKGAPPDVSSEATETVDTTEESTVEETTKTDTSLDALIDTELGELSDDEDLLAQLGL